MGLRTALAGALLISLAASPASAMLRITQDRGGQIGHYLQSFAQVRDSGRRVVIDGFCLSACTLVLAVVPRERICVTPRASLGFHAAWVPDTNGRPAHSREGTRMLWSHYPPHIRRWITRNGGLSDKMIFLRGRPLTSMYSPC